MQNTIHFGFSSVSEHNWLFKKCEFFAVCVRTVNGRFLQKKSHYIITAVTESVRTCNRERWQSFRISFALPSFRKRTCLTCKIFYISRWIGLHIFMVCSLTIGYTLRAILKVSQIHQISVRPRLTNRQIQIICLFFRFAGSLFSLCSSFHCTLGQWS